MMVPEVVREAAFFALRVFAVFIGAAIVLAGFGLMVYGAVVVQSVAIFLGGVGMVIGGLFLDALLVMTA